MQKLNLYKEKDIVFVNNFYYGDGTKGAHHSFIIINESEAIDIDYFAFLISSRTEKLDKNKFPYNMPLFKNKSNNLRKDSIVKCDAVIELKEEEIKGKFGEVSDAELKLFKEKFEEYIKNIGEV